MSYIGEEKNIYVIRKKMATTRMTALQNQITQLRNCFDGLRTDVANKLNECNTCIQSAESLCREITEMATQLEDKLANVSDEEKEWKETKVKLGMTSVKGMVILNVGGDRYTTSVDTLTRHKDTFFTALLSKQWQLECDPKDNSIFIDRNGKLFTYILEYLRTDIVLDDVMTNEILRQKLIIEAKYFCLHSLIDILTKAGDFLNGTLLTTEHKKILNEFYGKPEQNWVLIYKASRDGFDSNAFHTRRDNQKPTMTIVRSNNNYLFGGYASEAWVPNVGSYMSDSRAFLFTLTNPHNIPPTKYLVNPQNTGKALQYHIGYGPIFGQSDIAITSNQSGYFFFPADYLDSTGKGANTFTGTSNFTTLDIEVFKLS